MKKDRLILLRIVIFINGILLLALGLYIFKKANDNQNLYLLLFGFIPVIISVLIIGSSFFISQSNNINLRTCESGTLVRIISVIQFKFKGFIINHKVLYHDEDGAKKILYINLKDSRWAVMVKPQWYSINTLDTISNYSFTEKLENNICQLMKVTFMSQQEKKTIILINKPVRLESKLYQTKKEEGELLKRFFIDKKVLE